MANRRGKWVHQNVELELPSRILIGCVETEWGPVCRFSSWLLTDRRGLLDKAEDWLMTD